MSLTRAAPLGFSWANCQCEGSKVGLRRPRWVAPGRSLTLRPRMIRLVIQTARPIRQTDFYLYPSSSLSSSSRRHHDEAGMFVFVVRGGSLAFVCLLCLGISGWKRVERGSRVTPSDFAIPSLILLALRRSWPCWLAMRLSRTAIRARGEGRGTRASEGWDGG